MWVISGAVVFKGWSKVDDYVWDRGLDLDCTFPPQAWLCCCRLQWWQYLHAPTYFLHCKTPSSSSSCGVGSFCFHMFILCCQDWRTKWMQNIFICFLNLVKQISWTPGKHCCCVRYTLPMGECVCGGRSGAWVIPGALCLSRGNDRCGHSKPYWRWKSWLLFFLSLSPLRLSCDWIWGKSKHLFCSLFNLLSALKLLHQFGTLFMLSP